MKKKITTVAQEQFKMAGERIKELECGQWKLYIYNMKNAGKKKTRKNEENLRDLDIKNSNIHVI